MRFFYLPMGSITGSTLLPAEVNGFRAEPRVAPSASEVNGHAPMGILDDATLLDQAIGGRLPAFDELVNRYRGKVIRLVSSIIGNGIEVEDLVQEIFIKVYLSLPKFRRDASFSTYLYTVAVNRCRDELRKMKLRRFFSFDDWFASNPSEQPSLEIGEHLESGERRAAVRLAMKRLPPQTRMLLYLREVEEVSYKELAEIFEVEMGTIKSRIARARDRLREELMPYIRGEV